MTGGEWLLVDSARQFFAVIEKYKTQEPSRYHLIVAVVEEIMRQGDEYIPVIDMSLAIARKGCEFAEDAIELLNFVAKGEAYVEGLSEGLTKLLDIANTAHAHALAMNEQFSAVRRSLFLTAKNLAKEIMQEQQQVSNVIESFEDIMAQYGGVERDLDVLFRCVDNFVNWWSDMKLGLRSLESSIPLIKLDGSNPLRESAVLKRWKRFWELYFQYQSCLRFMTYFDPKLLPPVEADVPERREEKWETKHQASTQQEEGHRENKRRQEAVRLEAEQLEEEQQKEAKRVEAKRQEKEQQKERRWREAEWQEEERQEAKHLEEEWLAEKRRQEAKGLAEKRQEVGEVKRLEEEQQEETCREDPKQLEAKQQEEEQQEAKRLEEEEQDTKKREGHPEVKKLSQGKKVRMLWGRVKKYCC